MQKSTDQTESVGAWWSDNFRWWNGNLGSGTPDTGSSGPSRLNFIAAYAYAVSHK